MLLIALQSLFDPGVVWVLIPLTALAIPIVAILSNPMKEMIRKKERGEARQLYERIVMEKLDVIKTAVAMGHSAEDIDELDRRLEKLVGSDQLKLLLDDRSPTTPKFDEKLLDSDLNDELEMIENLKSGNKASIN